MTWGRNIWKQGWDLGSTAIRSPAYSQPSLRSTNCSNKLCCLTIPHTYLLLAFKGDIPKFMRKRVSIIQDNSHIPEVPLRALLKFCSNHHVTAMFHPAGLGWTLFYGFQQTSTTSSQSKVHGLLPVLKLFRFIKTILPEHLQLPLQ